jgi:hypothetical protein
VVSAIDPHARILGCLDRTVTGITLPFFFFFGFNVAKQRNRNGYEPSYHYNFGYDHVPTS